MWRMTPRKFQALLNVHFDVMKAKSGSSPKQDVQAGFVDNISGW